MNKKTELATVRQANTVKETMESIDKSGLRVAMVLMKIISLLALLPMETFAGHWYPAWDSRRRSWK